MFINTQIKQGHQHHGCHTSSQLLFLQLLYNHQWNEMKWCYKKNVHFCHYGLNRYHPKGNLSKSEGRPIGEGWQSPTSYYVTKYNDKGCLSFGQ